MHTVLMIAGGFGLLAVCLLIAKLAVGTPQAMTKAAIVFIPLWLIGALINMWIGVAKAGYSVKEELPILVVIFALPSAAALIVLWRASSH